MFDLAELIDEAYERIGVENRTGFELRSAKRSLTLMLADWANRGVNRWTIQQTTIPLVQGQQDYLLGEKTIDVLSAVLRREGTDFNLERLSRDAWLNIPTKTSTGLSSQFYVDRQVNPIFRLWLTPDRDTDELVVDRLVQIEVPGDYVTDVGIPFRFFPCFVAGLAYYLSIKFNPERTAMMSQVYEVEFQRAAEEDRDRASFRVTPFAGIR